MDINRYSPKHKLNAKNLLNADDFSESDIYEVLHLARTIKLQKQFKESMRPFENDAVGMLISSANSRMRVSFELAVKQLGGETLYLSPNDVDFSNGLTPYDAINVLKRYGVKGIVIKNGDNELLSSLSASSPLPLINVLDATNNPCQVLANLFTMWERKGALSGLSLAYVGNATDFKAHTLKAYSKCGISLTISSPESLALNENELDEASQFGDIVTVTDPYVAVKNVDFISSRFSFASGEKPSDDDKIALAPYRVDNDLLSCAKPDAYFMHILPVEHSIEVDEEVLYGDKSLVFDQAENLLYIEKALLILLFNR